MADSGDEDLTLVLADGLGSGVKANILSTLTSKILCTMIAGGMPVEECVDTIASTLPVCRVRKVAYSTFTIIRISDNNEAELIQFDNPAVIVPPERASSTTIPGCSRELSRQDHLESRFPHQEDDVLIAMSDGAHYAGVGKDDQLRLAAGQHHRLCRGQLLPGQLAPSSSPPSSSTSATGSTRASRATIPPWPWCASAPPAGEPGDRPAGGPKETT